MAALSAQRPTPNILQGAANGTGYILDVQVGATEVIYQGSFTSLDTSDQFLAALTKPDAFYGLSLENVTGGSSNGDVLCKVLCEAVFQHALSSVAVGDIGKPVFASDDQTLSLLATGADSAVGVLVGVPATGTAIVKMYPPRIEGLDWAVSNWTSATPGAVSADGSVGIIGDGFGDLVSELIDLGILRGAVTT